MNNKETAEHLRYWLTKTHGKFAWPTDGCGYEQHIKFVKHRNKHWIAGQTKFKTFKDFVFDYCEWLEKET